MDSGSLRLPSTYSRLSKEDRLVAVFDALLEGGINLDSVVNAIGKGWADTALESFNAATVVQVFGLASILAENQPLTVRGAMYRGIGALWKDSSEPNYEKCSRLILQMRRLGLIPYSWIVDGTRAGDKPASWSGLEDYAETVAYLYRKDLWAKQPDYIEVFVEKDAMSGVIRPVTREYDVRLNPIRGFSSETFLWAIAEEWKEIEKPIFVYYLGDHDPAGLSIERDLRSRLEDFCNKEVHWERLAVNDEDFADPELLGFPVKRKDTQAKWRPYLEQYGDRCVEVDAIPAPEIRKRVEDAIESHIDQDQWRFLKDQEEREKQDILDMIRNRPGNQT